MRLVNFWASFQTVTMKKKTFRIMMKHTGPKKLQMRPSFRDNQQLFVGRTHVFTIQFLFFLTSPREITAGLCNSLT